MYNLVLIENPNKWDCYSVAVFDKKNNEIWNGVLDTESLLKTLKTFNFPIEFVIHQYLSSYDIIEKMNDCDLLNKCEKIFMFDLVKLSDPIANESKSGLGLARLVHRNFLSSLK